MKILVIDDNIDSLNGISTTLNDFGYEIESHHDPVAALKSCESYPFPLIITDIRMPLMTGLDFLEKVKKIKSVSRSDVILMTGFGNMDTAIKALRLGAFDSMLKPINAVELKLVVERSLERQSLIRENMELTNHFDKRLNEATQDIQDDFVALKARIRKIAGISEFVYSSKTFANLVKLTKIYHDDPSVPVLIEGETGTGKEIIAQLIHHGDGISDLPFVDINCSSSSRELFESELFGYEPGAFTGGARKGSRGRITEAEGGTLFLDEIGDLPLELQPKLLRVLQQKTYYRVGGVKKHQVDTRFVFATNHKLSEDVKNGLFRRDLYHRLMIGHIVVPPLRDRKDDIRRIAEFFLLREAQKKKRAFKGISPEAMALFEGYSWPGNVRELENTIERAVLVNNDDLLLPEHIDFLYSELIEPDNASEETPADQPGVIRMPDESFNLDDWNKDVIRKVIHYALDRFSGNKTRTAEFLGLSRHALRRRLSNND